MKNIVKNNEIYGKINDEEKIKELSEKIDWSKKGMNGMIPVIAQDIETKEVLMQAYANKEAFENTLKTGNATYWSRSRNELWEKGLTSGATQKIYEIKIDCDNDSIIYLVEQLGNVGACHIEGQNSCFDTISIQLQNYTKNKIGDILDELYSTLEQRKSEYEAGKIGPTESYTVKLLDKGIDSILKKISEEVTELILGIKNNDKDNIIYELSDVLYFLNVLMVYAGIQPSNIADELARRFGTSGITEKNNRIKK